MMNKVLLLLASLCMVSYAQDGWTLDSYPDPQQEADYTRCGHNRMSYVCDPHRYLSNPDALEVDKLIMHIQNYTRCQCSDLVCERRNKGYKVSVALLNKIQQSGDNSLRKTLDSAMNFAYNLMNRWSHDDCGESLIILYAKEENVFVTVTGSMTGKKLHSAVIGDISVAVRPDFTPKTVYKGLEQLITRYEQVFRGTYTPKINPPDAQAVVGQDNGNTGARVSGSLLLLVITALLLH